jgi:hypothetical protein
MTALTTAVLIMACILGLSIILTGAILIGAYYFPDRFFWVHQFLTYAVEPSTTLVIQPTPVDSELLQKYHVEKWQLRGRIQACWKQDKIEDLLGDINRFDFAYRDIIPQHIHAVVTEQLREQLITRTRQIKS